MPGFDGGHRLAIGDVSGKGVPAGLVMTLANAVVRSVAASARPLDAVLARANDLLGERMEEGANRRETSDRRP